MFYLGNVLVSLVNIHMWHGCNEGKTRETLWMHKYGKSKTTWIIMAMYVTPHPEWNLHNFRPLDFIWTECTKPTHF